MAGCGHQTEVDRKDNRDVVFSDRRRLEDGIAEGQAAMAQEQEKVTIHLEHNPQTDVMFVDLCVAEEGAVVCVVDVGEMIGFPGQVQARMDQRRQKLYGITIQNYSGFKRKLWWNYHIWSAARFLQLLVTSLRAGLRIDHHHPAVA